MPMTFDLNRARKLADALLDRVVHNAHRLKLKGPSRRKSES
jgi:DNA replication protein DnaC